MILRAILQSFLAFLFGLVEPNVPGQESASEEVILSGSLFVQSFPVLVLRFVDISLNAMSVSGSWNNAILMTADNVMKGSAQPKDLFVLEL